MTYWRLSRDLSVRSEELDQRFHNLNRLCHGDGQVQLREELRLPVAKVQRWTVRGHPFHREFPLLQRELEESIKR